MRCEKCDQSIECDEGKGNYSDGWICYECLEEKK